MFSYSERLLRMRDESLLAVADQGETPRGTLLIGANEATCLYVLPEVFAEYCRLYPGVQISTFTATSAYKIIEKLENGSIDVGIVTLPVKSPSLKVHSIFSAISLCSWLVRTILWQNTGTYPWETSSRSRCCCQERVTVAG